jgi:hypothetical protein
MKPNLGGAVLGAGAGCIFVAWCLMPDAATNDAAHILSAVGGARARVHASALLQLLGSALLVPGLLAEARGRRGAMAGTLVMLWGALGMAADAVFHQLAFQMTAVGVERTAVLPVMQKMQTVELAPHLPLLLAFLFGAPLLGWQVRSDARRVWPARFLFAPVVTIPVGILAVRLCGLPRRAVALLALAEICAGLIGLSTRRGERGS